MKKIGLLIAMNEESNPVFDYLGVPNKIDKIGDFTVKNFIKNDCSIFVIISGTGEIMASCSTQILILKYGVELVVNYGYCGSLSHCEINELCVVSNVVHYDYDVSEIEDVEVGQYTRFSSPLVEADKDYVEIVRGINPKITKVVCASGDKFVSDVRVKQKLSDDFFADICDMECAGVLFTAKANHVPSLFIKLVSDKSNSQEFGAFLLKNNNEFVVIFDKLLKIFN